MGRAVPISRPRGAVRANHEVGAGADGSVRTGRAPVDSGRKAGPRVTVWLDSNGQFTEKPPAAKSAAVEAGTLGTGAALAFGGLVFTAGRLAQWRLDQRRYDRWGREGDQVGPHGRCHADRPWGRVAHGGRVVLRGTFGVGRAPLEEEAGP
jgi:hypothetical protein